MEIRFHFRQLVSNHVLHAGVLQAHGVQHPIRRFGDAGGGVAKTGGKGGALKGEGAQAVDIVKFGKLLPVAKAPAGGNDGVIEPDPAQVHRQIHHSNSSFRNTGPSLHTRLGPNRVSMEQPMQAPKPQAMRSSREY